VALINNNTIKKLD